MTLISGQISAALTGFEFTFRGDERFSPERVKWLEQIINRQLHGLLSQKVLYTKDIFMPESFNTTCKISSICRYYFQKMKMYRMEEFFI